MRNRQEWISINKAELVIFSDAVFDSVKDEPFPGGIAVSGEKIEFVGSKEAAARYIGAYTVVKDFGGKLVMPGICDCHVHLESSVKKKCALVVKDLESCGSEEECARVVREFADKNPEIERINGIGWALSNFGPNAKTPTKASIDKLVPDIPVYLFGADGHTIWINSKAIEDCGLAQIMEDNPRFPASYAPKDDNGEFTGFLQEAVSGIVYRFASAYPAEVMAGYYADYTRYLNSLGITAISELSWPAPESFIENYWPLKALENRGELTVRFYLSASPRGGMSEFTAGRIKELDALQEFFRTDKLRIAGIKTLLDGIPFAYTAALLEPYSDDPTTKGGLLVPPEAPMEWFKEANRLGYSIRVHCCGDAAVRLALDCFEESNRVNDNSNIRNAIEHLDCPADDDIPRFAKLGVIASVQPAHLILVKGILAQRYGGRIKNEWCFRKLADAGTKIALGTDSPVVEINPYLTIYNAVTRLDSDGAQYSPGTADQALTLAEVLKGYTVNAAYLNAMERKAGTLEAGKYADIAVSDKNLFAVPADELKERRTVCTVFNGKIVYEE